MQALLSPHSSTALAFQDQTAFLVGQGKPPQALQPAEVAAWLSAHEEMRWHPAEDFSAVEDALSLYSRRREALDLALISLDGELSLELRDEAQQELENLLSDRAVADWVLNLFHLRPLPTEAVVDVALSQAQAAQRRRVRAWLEPVSQRQAHIAESWATWSVMPETLLQPAGGRQALIDAALEKGLFVNTMATVLKNADPFSNNPKSLTDLIGLIAVSLNKQKQDIERSERLLGTLMNAYVRPNLDESQATRVSTLLPDVENIDLAAVWDMFVTEEIVMEGRGFSRPVNCLLLPTAPTNPPDVHESKARRRGRGRRP